MSTKELINNLLYEEESNTLDFKSEQYKFVKAQDFEKAELLKDVISFSNAWRRTDAYILIGVKEVKGGKSEIVGISSDLDDAQLQQFVQSKINKPISFSYITLEMEGKKIAIIHIPVQSRPVYLKKDYGKLKANTVYIRRGSSTDPALPDEIASMGLNDNIEVKKSPKLKAFIACGEHDEIQQDNVNQSVVLAEIPEKQAFPKYGESAYSGRFGIPDISMSILEGNNEEYYSEFAAFYKLFKSLFILRFGVKNVGNLVARDVQAVIDFQGLPAGSKVFHERELPELPKPKNSHEPLLDGLKRQSIVYSLSVKTIPDGYRVNIDFGKIQSKFSQTCSESLYLHIPKTCQISASVTIYSDDLESPEKLKFPINVSVEEKEYSVSDIINLAE